MRLVELESMSDERWQELGAEEPDAWGGGAGETWEWREKDLHLGLLDHTGRLVATAEAARISLAVEGAGSFDVVGVGGVFVRAPERGGGLMRRIVTELLERARDMGPERAMLFCHGHLASVYASFGFIEIPDPVWAEQPAGRQQVPLGAMWLALHGRPGWPRGRVDVEGLPF